MNQPVPLSIPVAFLVFNRPECTRQVLAEIRVARPPVLLVVADGPRPDRPGDIEKCIAVRRIIEEEVDWPCTVLKNYAPENLGCRNRVASGLDWVFREVETAIILEDDCLPHPDFFSYCEELLLKYRDNLQIGAICGSVPCAPPDCDDSADYYFSRHPYIWGWATWRRAWTEYRVDMPDWPVVRQNIPHYWDCSARRALEWRRMFDTVFHGKINTWDYQWFYLNLKRRWLSVVPYKNLVKNIGFGPDATHTNSSIYLDKQAVPTGINRPLRHPVVIRRNVRNDEFVESTHYRFPGLLLGLWLRSQRLIIRPALLCKTLYRNKLCRA